MFKKLLIFIDIRFYIFVFVKNVTYKSNSALFFQPCPGNKLGVNVCYFSCRIGVVLLWLRICGNIPIVFPINVKNGAILRSLSSNKANNGEIDVIYKGDFQVTILRFFINLKK